MVGLVLSSVVGGCVDQDRAVTPRAPEPTRLLAPQTYSGSSGGSGDLQDVCRIDPSACPSLDMKAEARRPLRENIVAIQQLSQSDTLLSGPLSGAPAVRAQRRMHSGVIAEAAPVAPGAIPVGATRVARAEMLDIEAHVSIDVASVAKARSTVLELLKNAGGELVNEVLEDQASTRGASLSLRVPSTAVHAFLTALVAVGRIRAQRVETKEISRTAADAETLQRNLERALARYQELLEKAANVTEALAIEAELQRVRTSLERVRGDLEWMRDRVARSTVYVSLSPESEAVDTESRVKVHPGVRGTLLFDVPPSADGRSFAGAGLSLSWSRSFSIDLDLMKRMDHASDGSVDGLLTTLGGDFYSDFLGRGRRRWFNPYFGARVGYARVLGQNALTLGGTLGLEVFKSTFFTLELQGRAHALIGPSDGVHLGIQPLLGMSFAY